MVSVLLALHPLLCLQEEINLNTNVGMLPLSIQEDQTAYILLRIISDTAIPSRPTPPSAFILSEDPEKYIFPISEPSCLVRITQQRDGPSSNNGLPPSPSPQSPQFRFLHECKTLLPTFASKDSLHPPVYHVSPTTRPKIRLSDSSNPHQPLPPPAIRARNFTTAT